MARLHLSFWKEELDKVVTASDPDEDHDNLDEYEADLFQVAPAGQNDSTKAMLFKKNSFGDMEMFKLLPLDQLAEIVILE